MACEACCDLLQPRIMSALIDNGAARGDLAVVRHEGLLMLSVLAVGAVFAMSRNVISSIVSQKFGAELRQELYVKIQSLRMDQIDKFQGGSLVTRETSDVTQLQNFINGLMRMFFKAPVLCVGAVVMSATLDIKTLPVILVIVLVVGAVITASMRLAYPRFARVQAALDNLNTRVREYLAGIRLVKAFRRFGQEAARFSAANDALAGSTIAANRVLAVFSPCMSLTVNLGVAAILLLGARWVGAGAIRVGAVMAFITYLTQILTSLNMISNILNMMVRVRASNERIAAVLNVPAYENPTPDAVLNAPGVLSAHIEFRNVSFNYKDSTGQAALDGISFSLEKGRTLGVIGPTGSGKSTLGSLLMRFYDATGGEILIDGQPLKYIPEKVWRERAAIVPQTAALFTGTIGDNIRWGKNDASDDEMAQAAKSAEAYEFIEAMPEGFGTLIGQNGVNLSGGQKQRVSIARALVRRPDVMVLDDCTSALDMVTEAKVRRALRACPMTCVLVTQRIATAMNCDRVLVLENGRQAGFGSHDELMRDCAPYRDIYISQIGQTGTEAVG